MHREAIAAGAREPALLGQPRQVERTSLRNRLRGIDIEGTVEHREPARRRTQSLVEPSPALVEHDADTAMAGGAGIVVEQVDRLRKAAR